MPGYYRVGGEAKELQDLHVRVGGEQKRLLIGYERVAGEQKIIWQFETPAAPGVPIGLKVDSKTSSSINFSWTAVEGADCYDYQVSTASNFATTAADDESLTTNASATGLTHNTTYYIRVRAKNDYGTSAWATAISTTTDTIVPGAITNLRVTSFDHDSINIAWNAGTDAVTYDWQFNTNSNFSGTAADSGNTASLAAVGDSLSADTLYYIRVRSRNAAGTSSWTSINQRTATSRPPTPDNLRITDRTTTSITSAWNAVAGIDRYEYEYDIDTLWTNPVAKATTTNTSVEVTGLNPDTLYYVRVRTQRGTTRSWYTDPVNGRTLSNKPSDVTNLRTTNITTNSIRFVWRLVSGADGYDYQVNVNSNFSGTHADSGSTNATGRAVTSTGLSENTRYYIRVRSKSGTVVGDWVSINARTETSAVEAPGAVTGLAVDEFDTSTIDISWNSVSGATGYDYEYNTNSNHAAGSRVANGSITTTSHDQTGLTANTLYYIRVRATNEGGNGDWATISQRTAVSAPGAVTGLTVDEFDHQSIDISWTAVSGATSYDYQYNTASNHAAGTRVVDSNTANTSHDQAGLSASTTYYIRVRARNSAGTGGWADVQQTTAATPVTAPGAVTNLHIDEFDDSTIDIGWNSTPRATSYDYQYNTASNHAQGTRVASGNISSTSHDQTGLTANTLYYIRVRARNSAGAGAWATINQRTSLSIPDDVTDLHINNFGSTNIEADWSAVSGATSYDYEYNTASNHAVGTRVANGNITATVRNQTGLTANTLYYIRVRARNSAGASAWDTISQRTSAVLPARILNDQIGHSFRTEIVMTWNSAARATSYDYEIWGRTTSQTHDINPSIDFTASASRIRVSNGNTTTRFVRVENVVAGRDYYGRIRGTNNQGDGDWTYAQYSGGAGAINYILSTATLSAPTITSSKSGNATTISWNAVTGANWYFISVQNSSRLNNNSDGYHSAIRKSTVGISASNRGANIFTDTSVTYTGSGNTSYQVFVIALGYSGNVRDNAFTGSWSPPSNILTITY